MHPNPAFRTASAARNLAFARDRAFGQLSINGAEAPLVAHVPFLLTADGGAADLHLIRANPIARALKGPCPALLSVSGPDGYISPDWYGDSAQVPTWNYVAVHLRGRLEPLPDAALADLLARLSDAMEARLPKPPWRMDKTPQEALARMMRAIRPFRLHVESVDGTWKLSQNKPAHARTGAADRLASGFGHELGRLAALMREEVPPQ